MKALFATKLFSTVIAAVVGAVLAGGAAYAVVNSQTNSTVTPSGDASAITAGNLPYGP